MSIGSVRFTSSHFGFGFGMEQVVSNHMPVQVGFGSSQVQIHRVVSSSQVIELSEASKVRMGSLRVQRKNEWCYFGLNVESGQLRTSTRGTGNVHGSRLIFKCYIPDPEENCMSRRIASQLMAKKEFLENPEMEDVRSILKKQGWEKILQERALVNESQFKEFYTSLKVEKKESRFTANFKIGGQMHAFTNIDVARLMGVPCGGYDKYIPYEWDIDVDVWESFKTFVKHEYGRSQIGEVDLAKLLHHIVTKSLVPRDEKDAATLVMDLVIIDQLMQEEKVNLPALVMQHMKHCKTWEKKALPYPTLVKKLLVDQGVYKEEDEKVYEIKFDESLVD